jgi:hypothetical protein
VRDGLDRLFAETVHYGLVGGPGIGADQRIAESVPRNRGFSAARRPHDSTDLPLLFLAGHFNVELRCRFQFEF